MRVYCPSLVELTVLMFYPERLTKTRKDILEKHMTGCKYCHFDRKRFHGEFSEEEKRRYLAIWERTLALRD